LTVHRPGGQPLRVRPLPQLTVGAVRELDVTDVVGPWDVGLVEFTVLSLERNAHWSGSCICNSSGCSLRLGTEQALSVFHTTSSTRLTRALQRAHTPMRNIGPAYPPVLELGDALPR
jgi:hypothetical protein